MFFAVSKSMSWFSLEQERQLGRSLAEFLKKNLAPALMTERRQVLSANRVSRLLEQAFAMAREHKSRHGLGFVGKTILAKSFKSSLEDAGYPPDFVTLAVEGLIVELSRRTPPPQPK